MPSGALSFLGNGMVPKGLGTPTAPPYPVKKKKTPYDRFAPKSGDPREVADKVFTTSNVNSPYERFTPQTGSPSDFSSKIMALGGSNQNLSPDKVTASSSIFEPKPIGTKTMDLNQNSATTQSKIITPEVGPITQDDIAVDEENKVDYNKTKTSEAYSDALAELSGAAAGEGLSGTNAAIAKGRQGLAAATKQAEARAGALAQSTGALGQGTANSLAQQTKMSVLQELSGQEMGFAELRGQDQKEAIDKIIGAEQAEKDDIIAAESIELQKSGQNLTIEQLNRQFSHMDAQLLESIATRIQNGEQFNQSRLDDLYKFDKSMELTEKQWTAEFGAEQGNNYMNALLELSVDNPVLARKIQNHLLTGGEGDLGAFTPDEIAEMERLKTKAEEEENNINNIYSKQLELLEKQIDAETTTVTGTLAGQTAFETKFTSAFTSGDYSKITAGEFANLTTIQKQDLAASSTSFTPNKAWSSGSDPDNYSDSAAQNLHWEANGKLQPGQAVMHNGTVYIITNPAKVREAGGDNKRVQTMALNTETGEIIPISTSDKFEGSYLGDDVKAPPSYTDSEGNIKNIY